MEKWKELAGYEGKYLVSNLGRVKSLPRLDRRGRNRISGGILSIMDQPYSRVMLCDKSKVLVHRLVAITFIPNPENKPEVNHKNGIKTDNRVENLEWVTKSENEKHAHKIGLKRPNRICILSSDDVYEIRRLSSVGISGKVIHKSYPHVSYHTISDVIAKRRWRHI